MAKLSCISLIASVLALSAPATARAGTSVAGMWDMSVGSEVAGHGAILVDWRTRVGAATVTATFNTEALRVGLHNVRLADDLYLSAEVGGEAVLHGVLTDYWVRGVNMPERGFLASWAGGSVQLSRKLGRGQVTTVRLAPRRHFFGSADVTAVEIPEDFTLFEQAVGYTYWGFDPDVMDWRPHQWFLRLRGFGFGAEVQSLLRSDAERWGHPDDPRNDPSTMSVIATQWAGFGVDVAPRLRVQLREEARLGFGEDDVTRRRVGGQTPYVVQVPGAPWPGFLASHLLAGHASVHWNAFGDTELGVSVDGVVLDDPGRTGASELGALGGAALFGDVRYGRWQLDVRVGAALPTRWLEQDLNLGAFVGIGARL